MEKSNIPEEVTITPIIKDLERLVLRLYVFVKTVLLTIANLLVSFIKHCVKYFLVLGLAAILGGVIGYYSDSVFPRGFSTTMVLKPTVASKTQLYNDVNYINSLIKKEESEALSNLFGITIEEAQTLSMMKVSSFSYGMDRLLVIDEMHKRIDSSIFRKVNLSLPNEGEDDIFAKKYEVSVFGSDPKVFGKLEPKFIAFLERLPELQERRLKAISMLKEQRNFYSKQLQDLDKLKEINNKRMLKDAENSPAASGTSISLGKENQSELVDVLGVYQKADFFFKEIIDLDSKLFSLKSCYELHAHFSEYGTIKGYGKIKRALFMVVVFFVLAFGLTCTMSIKRSTIKSDA